MDKKRTKPNLAASPLVYVEWVDAVSDGGWEEHVKVDVHPVKTVGFLIAETKEGICLASTISGESSNARMHIPLSWIIKRKVIKLEATVSKRGKKKVSSMQQDKEATPIQ